MTLDHERRDDCKDCFVVVRSKSGGSYVVWAPMKDDELRQRVCWSDDEGFAKKIARLLNKEHGLTADPPPASFAGTLVAPDFLVTDHAQDRWGQRVRRSGCMSIADALRTGTLMKTDDGQDALMNDEADALFYLKRDGRRWVVLTVVRLSLAAARCQ